MKTYDIINAGSRNRFLANDRIVSNSGRIVQLQNLYRNSLPDLEEARGLVSQGDYEALDALYNSVPEVLAQCVRTAFIPAPGYKFIVADFSAIEARVLAWIAGEKWVLDVFEQGGDIYCETASRMFHVPVEKHGINGDLRQKGKQATLSCIAEGELVLTDIGLVPIQNVTTAMKVWDGEGWVNHGGVVYRGEREVITYEGLTATPDHLVFIEGQQEPVYFGLAASCGAHLIQTGDGRGAIWLGEDYKPGKKMESKAEPLLCLNTMPGLRSNSMAEQEQPHQRKVQRVSKLFSAEKDSAVAGQTAYSSKTEMRESKRSWVQKLWGKRNKVRLSECDGSRTLFDSGVWTVEQKSGIGSDRRQRKLCTRKFEICNAERKLCQSTDHCTQPLRSGLLALCGNGCKAETIPRSDQGRDYCRCREGSQGKAEKLAADKRTARLYDIRNAGRHHRFTVSGKLVHNCGYGGSVGALIAMGALEAGMKEEELQPLVAAWREANPNIVSLWWDVDRAVKDAIKQRTTTKTHGLAFEYRGGMLYITLPSGRQLCYVKPQIGENRFGGESVTYMGLDMTKHWSRIESYGPKFVENLVQGLSRDILCFAMKQLSSYRICAHVHDEVIVEAHPNTTVEEICSLMSTVPPWAPGLCLKADGYQAYFYCKDS